MGDIKGVTTKYVIAAVEVEVKIKVNVPVATHAVDRWKMGLGSIRS